MIIAVSAIVIFGAMIAEAVVAARNDLALRGAGAVEPRGDVYRLMQVAYPVCFGAMLAEGAWRSVEPDAILAAGAAIFAAAKALKYWAIASLGSRWTFRVLRYPACESGRNPSPPSASSWSAGSSSRKRRWRGSRMAAHDILPPRAGQRAGMKARLTAAADAAVIGALILAVQLGPVPLRVHDTGRLLFIAAALAAIRHAANPADPLHRRIARGVRARREGTALAIAPAALGTRAAVLFVGYMAVNTIGLAPTSVGFTLSSQPLLNLPARFDAGWYAGIALDGYSFEGRWDKQQNIAFFPASSG